ncbi:MAG: protein-disulfide reductase DsbD, partial [Burkholderiales bacterium]
MCEERPRTHQERNDEMINSCLGLLRLLVLPLLMTAALPGVARAADFLDPQQAFRVTLARVTERAVELDAVAADGYYLYAAKFSAASDTPGVRLGELARPAGTVRFDATFGKEVETHRGSVRLSVPIRSAPKDFALKLDLQGCADAGLCYPPMTVEFPVALAAAVAGADASGPASVRAQAGAARADVGDEFAMIERTLAGGSLLGVASVFLVLGLLLSFTPCVLPMVPILSSIIVGQQQLTRGRGFALALAYSLGMAMVYTAVGVAAGLAGEGLAAALQKPWVLAMFASLLVALALSMFDLYQLEMPQFIQNRAARASARLPGGRFAGVFVMGAVSALVVGPCVAAPLAGALVYISQTRNVVTGG